MARRKAPPNLAIEQFEEDAWIGIKELAEQMDTDYAEQDAYYQDVVDVYQMEWKEQLPDDENENLKLTMSPDLSAKLVGAQRLLTATEPTWSIPFKDNDANAKQASDMMEKAARLMWQASGRLSGLPAENDVVLAGLLFSEMHIGLTNLAEELARLPEGVGKFERARLEEAVRQTPILFEAWNPMEGKALRDKIGLIAYKRSYRIFAKRLSSEWPGVDFDHLGKKEVDVEDWYDGEWRCVWIKGEDKPFYMRKHGLPFIPIICQVAEGSNMWTEPEKRARGFLYNVIKSEMHLRANLALTALFTNVFAFAINPMFQHTAPPGNPEKRLTVNMDTFGGVIEMETGERFEPMAQKGAIDPALLEVVRLVQQKINENTIYDQALGEPLGSNAPFSMVALLHQAGRLPLSSTQKMGSWALADAMEKAFKWIKFMDEEGTFKDLGDMTKDGSLEVGNNVESVAVDPAMIPDRFTFDAKLDIDLPTDKLQQGQAAAQFANNKLASKRWIRENLLNIGASDEMDEEIWGEDMADLLAMEFFRQQKGAEDQQNADAQAAAQAGATSGGGNGGAGGGSGVAVDNGIARPTTTRPESQVAGQGVRATQPIQPPGGGG